MKNESSPYDLNTTHDIQIMYADLRDQCKKKRRIKEEGDFDSHYTIYFLPSINKTYTFRYNSSSGCDFDVVPAQNSDAHSYIEIDGQT